MGRERAAILLESMQYNSCLSMFSRNSCGTSKRRNTKNTCVCKTLCPRWQQSPKKLFLAQRSTSPLSLTWVSFERALSVEYACQILSLSLLWLKSYSESQSWQQTNKHKHTEKQTTMQNKNNMPSIMRSSIRGGGGVHKNGQIMDELI